MKQCPSNKNMVILVTCRKHSPVAEFSLHIQVQLFAPLTETLSTFTKEQLQKLLQYAITSDPGAILGKVFSHFSKSSYCPSYII